MGRNSNSKHSNRVMEVEEPILQHPQLSGAYIRSLVKQLRSSTTKDPMKSKSRDGASAGMDDDEIAEIRSIGEQHNMEWNDTMNLMTSAWWSMFLKNMEGDPCESKEVAEEGFHMFDEVFNLLYLLHSEGDAPQSCLFQQHMNSCYNDEDYLYGAALPCFDIEEIKGQDGERV